MPKKQSQKVTLESLDKKIDQLEQEGLFTYKRVKRLDTEVVKIKEQLEIK